jgi:hypothetical protein
MSADVLQFRQRPVKGTQKRPAVPVARRLCCSACSADQFALYEDGKVYCGQCAAPISNIYVAAKS